MRLILGELGEAGGGDGTGAFSRRAPPVVPTTAGGSVATSAPELDILEYCLNDAVGEQLPGEPRSPVGAGVAAPRGVGSDSLLYQCRPFACRFCAKRFKRKDHLVEHERTHTGERPYRSVAEVVSVAAWEGGVVWNSDRRYACRACGRSFKKKDHVKEHYRVHTGEKPFVCPFCLKRFTRGRTLKTHITMAHPQP
ncbi:hypothetical protein Pcinc_022607 [Petrolisthes cinctipes]|uniref:C2H2-type domain-containing protein n=1 Tax=Petrolisthes cinctipes TaxID=88211 RepID=A0AAE1KFM8_PETCI|nr:hypothetical protein Pcinc_022607 [Petrolisthes cinctipes]